MTEAIGIDLGGTKIAGGVVNDRGEILRREETTTADEPGAIFAAVVDVAKRLGASSAAPVGVGAAGMIDFETGYYLFAPNVSLANVNLAQELSSMLSTRVLVDNDANVAAWAEHRFGCGRGTRHFLCVTLGTGIGGGIVIDGRPYRGMKGGAAEIGHMLVDPNGPLCGCGRRGCWEQLASGTALTRMARDELAQHPSSRLHEVTQGDASRLKGPMVTEAARDGDAFALDVLERLAMWVGWGLGSLVNILAPEHIAIAGGLARDWDLLEATAIDAVRERAEAGEQRELPGITAAALGPDAGIVGAATLVMDAVA